MNENSFVDDVNINTKLPSCLLEGNDNPQLNGHEMSTFVDDDEEKNENGQILKQ